MYYFFLKIICCDLSYKLIKQKYQTIGYINHNLTNQLLLVDTHQIL